MPSRRQSSVNSRNTQCGASAACPTDQKNHRWRARVTPFRSASSMAGARRRRRASVELTIQGHFGGLSLCPNAWVDRVDAVAVAAATSVLAVTMRRGKSVARYAPVSCGQPEMWHVALHSIGARRVAPTKCRGAR